MQTETKRQREIRDRLKIIDRPGISADLHCMDILRLRKEYAAITKAQA